MSSLSRREFLQSLAYAGAAGLNLAGCTANGALNSSGAGERGLYDLPSFGNVSVLHFTDCHAQLMPMYFREPNVNLGVGLATGRAPHLVGEHLLKAFGVRAGSAQAYAFTHLNFEAAAQRYGKVGGFAHLATLVKRMKANRPGALLLDGGDTWQGSATSLWSKGQDMVEACLLMGVDLMTGHWEFTHGDQRVKEIVDGAFKGKVEFIAQNIVTKDFEDAVFASHVMRHINGVKVAIIGQAFPYTPIANPRYFTPDWSFGIREEQMQHLITRCRSEGAKAVILLSHNGMDVDLKLASRVSGLDAILGGHTHDAVPEPMLVNNPGGKTLVANSGSNGKFLSVLDLDVKADGVSDFRYRLLPVFSNLLPADVEMQALIDRVRAPFKARLDEPLATTEGLLYRRGNFSGSFDQLILDALMEVKDAPIAFSPGFRWGTSLLPGQSITREHVMDQTAITYPQVTVSELSGETIKTILEDVCDNLFNPDPYYQQGGDMVRVGGLSYSCDPLARMGSRIADLRLQGVSLEASKIYKVAGWAPVAEGAGQGSSEAIWEVMENYLKAKKTITPRVLNVPRLIGMDGNAGMAGP